MSGDHEGGRGSRPAFAGLGEPQCPVQLHLFGQGPWRQLRRRRLLTSSKAPPVPGSEDVVVGLNFAFSFPPLVSEQEVPGSNRGAPIELARFGGADSRRLGSARPVGRPNHDISESLNTVW